jgi:hypothetical protein
MTMLSRETGWISTNAMHWDSASAFRSWRWKFGRDGWTFWRHILYHLSQEKPVKDSEEYDPKLVKNYLNFIFVLEHSSQENLMFKILGIVQNPKVRYPNFSPRNWEGYDAYSSSVGGKLCLLIGVGTLPLLSRHKNPPIHWPPDPHRFGSS